MRQSGMSRVRPHGLGVTAALLVVALVAGRFAADVASEQSLGRSPRLQRARCSPPRRLGDARGVRGGRPLVAFATSAGFLVAYAPHDGRLSDAATADPELDRAAAWSWRLLVSAPRWPPCSRCSGICA